MFKFLKKKTPNPTRKTTDLKISVVMPVYLGYYEGCADGREGRFRLAIRSFFNQKHENKQLIIVSDGCDIAEKIVDEEFCEPSIIFKKIEKQPLFSGNVRAEGIKLASGDVICYLDSDDVLGENHLTAIANGFDDEKLDWVYYNDLIFQPNKPMVRDVQLVLGLAGTSSIAHRADCAATWSGCNNYNHDWLFIKRLIALNPNYKKIFGAEYLVCHIPKVL